MANNQLNWSHFEPDFSGKPEDTEVHLLRTNDWITTHDFPDDQKVRRFCLTLSGEAGLWYEMLNAQQQQLTWAGLQESFRQQYSKCGNTREQYFHAWKSIHFDEATDTIDGYIQKVKQVAALLNYGEPQISELFKNTLPSKLYYMLYQINDLRVAVETAKRLLTKEQMDKKSGQATTSSFMQTSESNSKNKNKAKKNEKKVSFSVVEAIERTTDSIERLASLMDKMDTKLDRREDQYRPRIYQGRGRGCSYRQNNYRARNRSYSRDQYQNNYRGRGNYNRGGNRNYRSNYRDSSRSRDRNNYRDGNRYNNRSNYRREDSNQRYGNRNQDHSRSRERDRDKSSSRESSQSRHCNQSRDQSRNDNRRQSRNNTRDKSESRSRSSSHVSTNRDRCRCYRCNEYDHFARECPNDVTNGSSDDMGGSLLRMLHPDQTYALNYADKDDYDMDLNM